MSNWKEKETGADASSSAIRWQRRRCRPSCLLNLFELCALSSARDFLRTPVYMIHSVSTHAPRGGTRQEGSERKESCWMEGSLRSKGEAKLVGRLFFSLFFPFFFPLFSFLPSSPVFDRAHPAMAFVAAPARTRAMLSPSPLPRLIAASASSTGSSIRRLERRPMPLAFRRRLLATTSLSANPSKDSDPLVRAARSAASAAAAAAEKLKLKEK